MVGKGASKRRSTGQPPPSMGTNLLYSAETTTLKTSPVYSTRTSQGKDNTRTRSTFSGRQHLVRAGTCLLHYIDRTRRTFFSGRFLFSYKGESSPTNCVLDHKPEVPFPTPRHSCDFRRNATSRLSFCYPARTKRRRNPRAGRWWNRSPLCGEENSCRHRNSGL